MFYEIYHKLNLNTWGPLREYLKNRTKDYIANKAATFSNDEIDKAVLIRHGQCSYTPDFV